MKKTFLIADLHFGDSDMVTILRGNNHALRPFSSIEEHDAYLIENWNKVVTNPSDKVYVLGDVAQRPKYLENFAKLNGKKILIKGNHDIYEMKYYAKYFKDIRGTHRLVHPLCNGIMLSHIPVHPMTLGENAHKLNIHGHIHDRVVTKRDTETGYGMQVTDKKYYCVSAERIAYTPIDLEILMDILFGSGKIGETIQT
jgi:calcineurin-like phosphoesterase family protein